MHMCIKTESGESDVASLASVQQQTDIQCHDRDQVVLFGRYVHR